jgi:serine/threonine protein kinase
LRESEQHHRATTLFLEAAELDPALRAEWIERACDGDEELRRAVEAMLVADERAAGFLEKPPTRTLVADGGAVPERIGPYRVLGVLGHGGMGVVYEAVQETPHRNVAVKVLRAGAMGQSLSARFRYEAELLGRLQHPGIAQVYAAGTEESEGGTRPWIAMELVRGTPLLEFAREHELDRPARLELVARIADAVHHAHQRGIIHRDLKSANVLVDEAGDPKVLDFGVARAEGAELRANLTTTPGLIVGTLQTMSPEQAEASPDLDARTDVYSLGAIAYELLSGRAPLDLSALPLSVALL